MKTAIQLLILRLLYLTAPAQITFHPTDIPQRIGVDSWRQYADTSDKNVNQLIGGKAGPQRWDFSYPQAAGEDVWQVKVVARTDGGHGGEFTQAEYAEHVTHVSDGCQTWDYFKVVPGSGRFHSGFHDHCKDPQPDIVFDAPSLELPAELTLGGTWRREINWKDKIDAGGIITLDVAVHFVSESSVDAYGTLILPGIGEVPALRVNELRTYEFTDLTLGIPLPTEMFRSYYWLVPGIGVAVQMVSGAHTSLPPENFETASTVLRVFESSQYPPGRLRAENVRIALKGAEVFLSWDKATGVAGYQIEATTQLKSGVWAPLAQPSDNFYFDRVDTPSKFYRVFQRK